MAHKLTMFGSAVLVLVVAAASGALAQNKCAGTKIKAAGKKTACLLGLEAKEAQTGVAPPTDKVTKCEQKLLSTFTKAESKGGCLTTGDADGIEDKVDMFVDDVDAELGVGSVNGCQAAKLKAAAKKTRCRLGLEAKEAATGVAPAPDKVAKCNAKLTMSFAKAETKGGCATTGDADAIEDKVDVFVDDVDAELSETPTTTTTTTTASTTATTSTSTTTSPTTTTVAAGCCALASAQFCGYAPSLQLCDEVGGTPGAPNTVCDGATGGCQPTASPGPCCQLMGDCLGGPGADEACAEFEGTVVPDATCDPSGTCVVP
jgi:hypothetical protein